MDKKKKIIIGIIVLVGVVCGVLLYQNSVNKSMEAPEEGRQFNEADAPTYQKEAIIFIKEIYSDFRTIEDDREFNKKIDELVSVKNTKFRKILEDRKHIRDQFVLSNNIKLELKKHDFDMPKIISKTDKNIVFTVNGTYKYKALNDADLKKYEKEGGKDELILGGEVPYAVSVTKEKGKWKIENITSGDLTSSYMFEGLDTYTAKSAEAVLDLLQNKPENKYPPYNIEEIINKMKNKN